MDPERWQRIKEVLHSALEREPQERAAFLKEACADDPSLQSEVESLIASHEQAGGFIESPAFELMAESLGETQSIVGSDLGPYRVTGRLGAGGMGEVYLAEDTRLGRKVALKVLLAHFTRDEERVRRFQQEARAASALNHPNIVTIHEIGEITSRHFIVTEVIEGETLGRHLADAEIEIPEALDIAIQIASALSAAHAAGIVHRDIKPDNVMIRVDGIVKVLDFGLAKLTELKSAELEAAMLINTQEGMVMGTAHYMSPEQARGLAVDARTDIWSLGVVLYEMIGGRVPFEGDTSSDVIAAILGREPTTLARYAPEVPTELEWIVKKALRKDREERYQSAKELLSDLKSLKHRLEFEQELERSMDSGPQSGDLARRPGFVSSKDKRAQRQLQGAQSRKVIESLAILPLANSSADPSLEYFSDGITESIISSLSQLAELRVMAWSTVSRYKGREFDPRELGRDLGVQAVLTGRVVLAGERVVIKTELVNAMDGSHLWGESYSCEPSDILGIEAEISRAISEKLLVRLTTEERKQLTRRYPDSVEAYHAYLRGRYFWNKRSEEGLKKGIEHFQQAIDEDPGYAAAYAGMSDCYTILVVRYGLASEEGIPKAKAAAMKALEIDDTLAEAHTSLAHSLLHNWEWEKAEREFKRAVELNPNDANAHNFYAEYLRAMGRVEQAISAQKRAQELDPLSLNFSTGGALYFARRYDQAIDQCQKALEMNPNFFLAHYTLGQAYEQKGMFDEAITALQRAVELSPDNIEMLAGLGRVLAVAGRRKEAQRIVDQLEAGIEHRHSWQYDIALIYAGLGEDDRAFECLEKRYAWRDGMMIHVNVEPRFDSLRSDPRFQDLVRKMGLPPFETSRPPTLSRDKQRTETTKEQAARSSTHLSQSWWRRREAKISRRFPWAALVIVLGVLVFSSAALLAYRRFNNRRQDPSAPITSIAVLPLKNLSGDPSNDYFSDGMTDSLISALSKVEGLTVISRGSVFRFKGKEVDPREVGRQLGVAAVLEGSVMKSGETVRVGVRLVSAADGRVLWSSDPQDRALEDIFALQDEVAHRVVAGLRLKLGGEGEQRLAKRYTDNVEAYQAYMKGRYFWNKRNGEGFGKAIAYFQQAIEIDPNYALAYAGLADSYILKRIYALLQPGETLQQMEAKAKAAAEKALEIDDTLAEAHTSLGMIKANTENDEADIEREYKRAIELNPNYATAHHWYALHLNDMGRFDEAIAEIRRAREIDPLSLVINSDVGIVFSSARQYDQAIEHFKKAMEMDPNFPDAHAMLGWTYVRKGMYTEGIAEFEKARALFGSPTSQLDGLIYAYGMSGNRSEALKVLDKLKRLTKQHHTQIPWENWLFIHIGLGEHDKAFEVLEKAYQEGLSVKRLLYTPYVDPLRTDPRFADLLRRVGLPQ